MLPQPLNRNDLVALSDRAWTVVDPAGTHEAEEQHWVEELVTEPSGGFPLHTAQALQEQLAAAVAGAASAVESAHLQAVAAVIAFLAADPERHHLDQGVLTGALHQAFPEGIPAELADWLRERPELEEPPTPGPRPSGPRRH